ncbi:prepilin peptidase [Amycolatopsis circi]|uniref:prepilin peptidase n=1 Tax=Amycolatopsis circi TaxID=871959 RepID=UPI000E266F08|nr:A24 family peptidase [Amycolatopsis circi]
MVLTAVLAAGAVVPVLLVMTKKAGAPVSAVIGMTAAVAAVAVAATRADAGALPAWWLPVAWLVSVLGVPLALADARHRRLPDVLTLPAYPAVALTITLATLSGGGWRLAAGAVLGCLLFGGTHLIVHRLSAGGLGPGDVKLAGSFGAVLGAVGGLAPAVAAVLAAMVSMAAVVPMWLMRRIRQSRESRAAARPPSAQPDPTAAALVTAKPLPGIDSAVASSLRSETAGELHEPTPNQPVSGPQETNPAQPADPASAPTGTAPVPSGVALVLPGPAAAATGTVLGSTGTTLVPMPAASAPPTGTAHSRIRAGPLRVPYGPGLVLATWACAVFPAAGTGIV